ncbi:MAG: hypothetical protein RRY65_01475 [Pseudoflavonifractor sp.]
MSANLMDSPDAAKLLGDKEAIMGLLGSPDTKRLMELLSENAGGGLKTAASAAMQGDTGQLTDLLGRLMSSKEGAAVVGRIQNAVPKK